MKNVIKLLVCSLVVSLLMVGLGCGIESENNPEQASMCIFDYRTVSD